MLHRVPECIGQEATRGAHTGLQHEFWFSLADASLCANPGVPTNWRLKDSVLLGRLKVRESGRSIVNMCVINLTMKRFHRPICPLLVNWMCWHQCISATLVESVIHEPIRTKSISAAWIPLPPKYISRKSSGGNWHGHQLLPGYLGIGSVLSSSAPLKK